METCHWKLGFLQEKRTSKPTKTPCDQSFVPAFSLEARIFLRVNAGYRKAAVCFVFCNQNQKMGLENVFEDQLLWSVKQKQKETVAMTKTNVFL